jgi:hypothetical protein
MSGGYWKGGGPGGLGWLWRMLDKIVDFLGLMGRRNLVAREVSGTYQQYEGQGEVPFNYKLDEELTCILHIRVRVKLVLTTTSEEYYPWDGAALSRLDEQKRNWAEAIHRYWSNKYFIDRAEPDPDLSRVPNQNRYPCVRYSVLCGIEYVETGQHRDLEVSRIGGGENTANHLALEASPETAAHEYGHWLGLPHDDGESIESIMNGAEPSMRVWPQHYRRFAELFSSESGKLYTVGPPVL